jgi:hypothetical protein
MNLTANMAFALFGKLPRKKCLVRCFQTILNFDEFSSIDVLLMKFAKCGGIALFCARFAG